MAQTNLTYRDDEIVVILSNCNSLVELHTAKNAIGYLHRIGEQEYRPVVYKLFQLRENELIRNLKT